MPNRRIDWTAQCGLRFARTVHALELSHEELYNKYNVSRSCWGMWIGGKNPLNPWVMTQFCNDYKISMDWLYLNDKQGLTKRMLEKIDALEKENWRPRFRTEKGRRKRRHILPVAVAA